MKKYLNSPEEVIKALKEGKKVCLYSNQNLMEFYMVDGIICSKENINVCIWFRESDNYYTEETEPIKFEINRAYKTTKGFKAFLIRIEDDNINDEMTFLCEDIYSYNKNGKNIFYTNLDGITTIDNDFDDLKDFDIVGYWEE